VTAKASGPFNEWLHYLERNQIVLGRYRAGALLKQMSATQSTDRRSFSTIVAMIPQQA
jgi:hypothetical protein